MSHAPHEPAAASSSAAPPPDGLLDAGMTKLFGRSWRTGAIGLLGIGAAVIPMIPGLPPGLHDAAAALAQVLPNLGLMLAKDARVSGPRR